MGRKRSSHKILVPNFSRIFPLVDPFDRSTLAASIFNCQNMNMIYFLLRSSQSKGMPTEHNHTSSSAINAVNNNLLPFSFLMPGRAPTKRKSNSLLSWTYSVAVVNFSSGKATSSPLSSSLLAPLALWRLLFSAPWFRQLLCASIPI